MSSTKHEEVRIQAISAVLSWSSVPKVVLATGSVCGHTSPTTATRVIMTKADTQRFSNFILQP
ncbi:hypothetical protein [Flavobacterium fontis]|uniref:hypothetical protein n=1 Tax=Flavobacterium fontis TaxID=1124188 RepID=UPI001F2AF982|nr:hypothetical protein [Flavobacterium fontis]